MNIKIEYNGSYPNLCSGDLIVIVDETRRDFGRCLCSGGNVWFDDDCNEHIDSGAWSITEWPDKFPDDLKSAVLEAVNNNIEHGCCGGCV